MNILFPTNIDWSLADWLHYSTAAYSRRVAANPILNPDTAWKPTKKGDAILTRLLCKPRKQPDPGIDPNSHSRIQDQQDKNTIADGKPTARKIWPLAEWDDHVLATVSCVCLLAGGSMVETNRGNPQLVEHQRDPNNKTDVPLGSVPCGCSKEGQCSGSLDR